MLYVPRQIARYVWINKNEQDEKTWVSVDVQQARAPSKNLAIWI